jgi:enoyl-[acyl-carrier protein] reductase I
MYCFSMVVKNYNIMSVAKAALESYVAAELGPKGIRVHAISPRAARDPGCLGNF